MFARHGSCCPGGAGAGLGTLTNKQCSGSSTKWGWGGESQTLREADRRSMSLPFPLLSDWHLKFESLQMWHGLTFGIWIMDTAEITGDATQLRSAIAWTKRFSHDLCGFSRVVWAESLRFQSSKLFFREMKMRVIAKVTTYGGDRTRTRNQVF